ncbi:MAG: ribulose-phosphate 3-epimerase [Promethearchaeota archaeon]
MKIAVSIHAKDNFNPSILKGLNDLDYIHIDVMDGRFVKNVKLNLDVFKILKERYSIPIIAHLMVINPLNYVEKIIHHVDYFLFHYEIEENISIIIDYVKKLKRKVGLVINPRTKVSEILKYLPNLDIVLILGVNPGWSGQKFIPNTVNKVNELAKFKKNYSFLIDVDGGVNLEKAQELKNADILTSASTILNAKNPNRVIQKLKNI